MIVKHSALINFDENPIIAAFRTKEDFVRALETDVETVFLLSSNIMDVDEYAREAHEAGKKLFVCRGVQKRNFFGTNTGNRIGII